MDYRNAIVWYQYDPTKWFIYGMYKLGFASQLKSFPANEVKSEPSSISQREPSLHPLTPSPPPCRRGPVHDAA